MKYGTRVKILAVCIGAIFAQLEANSALADSGVGVDTALGNALNPPGRSSIPREVDPDGVDAVRRSPTGQLYGIPLVESEEAKKQDGWNVSGGVEAGMLFVSPEGKLGNSKAAQFRQYKDLKDGPYLNYFELSAEKPDSARFLQSFGGGVANSDQFAGLQFGRYNDWKVNTFYNETLHVFTDSWKSLFNGEGTGTMTIAGLARPNMVTSGNPTVGAATVVACTTAAPCWSYGGQVYSNATSVAAINGVTGTANATTGAITTGSVQSGMAAAINAKLAATSYTELALIRKKGGVRVDKTISDNLKGYASYTLEKRLGSRPFSLNDNNMSFDIAEPIDYDTHDMMMGLSYADDKSQANLRATASLFRNNISTLNVQLPLLTSATPMGAINTGTYDLSPNNDALNIKGEFARNFPDFYKSRFTVAASYGTNKENDALLAPISAAQSADLSAAGVTAFNPAGNTANPGYNLGTGLISNWNTTAALSRQSAGQEIDNKMVDVGFALKPVNDLNVKTSYHYFATDNKGGYVAYNPLTGQFGRGPSSNQGVGTFELLVAPGANGGCYAPAGYAVVAGCTLPTYGSNLIGYSTTGGAAGGGTNTTNGMLPLANGSNVPVFGQARSTKQSNFAIAADYDLTRTSSINAAAEREDFNRNFRERDDTWEYKYKLGYTDRSIGNASLRTSIEKDSKRGSVYNYRTWSDLGTGLPGLDINTQAALGVVAANLNLNANGTLNTALINSLADGANLQNGLIVYKNSSTTVAPVYNGVTVAKATTGKPTVVIVGAVVNGIVYAAPAASIWTRYSTQMRKYDQADRDQVIFNTRINVLARDDLDVGVNGQLKRANYTDSYYGLKEDNLTSAGLDFNFQPSSTLSLTGYYNFQKGSKVQSLNSGTNLLQPCITTSSTTASQATPVFSAAACADTSGGSTGARPDSAAWTSRSDDTNNIVGLGMMNDFGFVRLGIDYTFAQSRTTMAYSLGSTALAAAPSAALIALAGSALPDMTTVQNTVVINLIRPLDKSSSVRLLYRYEEMRIADWHYDSVITNAMANFDGQTLLTDSGPQRYSASVAGLMYQLKF
jgi:hypothetical protein